MQRVLGGVMLILIYNSFKILNVNLLNNRTHPIATGAWLTPQRALGKVTPCLVTENQFSLTRPAFRKGLRLKSNFLSISISIQINAQRTQP